MKEIFSSIIHNRTWSHTTCGPGSTLKYTENIRSELIPLVEKFNIKSILDLPCGDFSWMSTVDFPDDVTYIGGDIVEFMIEENQKNYQGKNFQVIDLSKDALPSVDLLICRDCLLHLSFSDIQSVFDNISRSNIKYVLTSNWFEEYDNFQDIETGKVRCLNFLDIPYNFPQPIYSIVDYIPGYPKREMLLWDKTVIDNFIKK